MKYKALGIVAIILIPLLTPAQSATITSVGRAAFAAAVAGGTIASQDFEGLAAGTILGATPDVTYGASLGQPIVTNEFLTTTAPNGLGSTSPDASILGFFLPGEIATFTFSAPITAFAIDVNTFATGDASYTATLNTGDVVTSLFEVFPGQITGQFIGFISDTPFSQVSITDTTGFSYTLDTLVYGGAAAVVVPVPAAFLLFFGGLSVLGLFRRRIGH